MSFSFEFDILPKVNQSIIEIERVRGFLDAIKSKGSWLVDLQNEILILESHCSTHIEGSELTLDQSRNILEDVPVKDVSPEDKRELLNYKEALEVVYEQARENTPITEKLIKELHDITVRTVRNNQGGPGNYRKVQNFVVDLNTQEIIYTPPPSSEVPRMMREFTAWLNTKKSFLSPVFIAGIAQIQLVNIHPFVDGNGRVARLLATLILYEKGYDFKKLFSISEYYDKNRPAYYGAIRSVSQHNMDLTWWLEYFVKGLQFQISKIREKAEDIIQLELLIGQLKLFKLNDCQEKIIGYIFFKGEIDNEKCQKICRMTKQSTGSNLVSLVKKNLIKKDGAHYIFSDFILEMITSIKNHR